MLKVHDTMCRSHDDGVYLHSLHAHHRFQFLNSRACRFLEKYKKLMPLALICVRCVSGLSAAGFLCRSVVLILSSDGASCLPEVSVLNLAQFEEKALPVSTLMDSDWRFTDMCFTKSTSITVISSGHAAVPVFRFSPKNSRYWPLCRRLKL